LNLNPKTKRGVDEAKLNEDYFGRLQSHIARLLVKMPPTTSTTK